MTQKKENDDERTDTSSGSQILGAGGNDRSHLCGADPAFLPISFGPIQFRISEALCILPYFTPAAVPGLFAGCLISNLLGGAVPMDVVFGSAATLVGAMGSYCIRRHKWLVCLPPIAANTVMIPWVLRLAYGAPGLIPVLMLTVGIGEVLAVGVLGNLLLVMLSGYRRLFK